MSYFECFYYIGLLSGYLVVKGCIKILYEAKYAGSESFESLQKKFINLSV